MALEKQKSRICEEEENDEPHCHYEANENERKKWILCRRMTLRLYDLTYELNMDMILDIAQIKIDDMINLNILICLTGFHSTEHWTKCLVEWKPNFKRKKKGKNWRSKRCIENREI